jgi:hypothetical protein
MGRQTGPRKWLCTRGEVVAWVGAMYEGYVDESIIGHADDILVTT